MKEINKVTVHILDKEYCLACPEGEEQGLRDAAHYLDTKMREIRRQGRIVGLDRLAVMAGLNIAHELVAQSKENPVQMQKMSSRIQSLQQRIDDVLEEKAGQQSFAEKISEQLEIEELSEEL